MNSRLDMFTGRSLVAFYPCGCWGAVQLVYADLTERARESGRFMKEQAEDGATRIEEMSHEEWKALRNGVNGDLTVGCDHDPQWGGAQSVVDECPRCWKRVKKLKNGRLSAHNERFGWKCSQEPRESRWSA